MAVPSENTWTLFGALGVIVVGNGMFKPNAANLVRKIYEGDDAKIDSAFTIYYMAVNVGSTVSMLLTPWIKDYVNRDYGHNLGWHAAFAVCCIGLVIGMVNFYLMRAAMRHIGSEPDDAPMPFSRLLAVLGVSALGVAASAVILQYESLARIFVYAAGVALLGIFALPDREEPPQRARRPDRGARARRADDFLLHLLPTDVDLARAVRAAQRRLASIPVRRASVDLDAGAVPGA